jgi:NAD(P)-dependent dehydrogenase (short-subunit alcohol dehydrogenase family)
MDLELNGKAAIVTGGSRGIGKAIARELAREGVHVAIVARNAEALEASARELAEETGGRIVPIVADTGDEAAVRTMVRRTADELGRLDILVNCAARVAGSGPEPKLADISDEAFFPDMNVKVLGYLRCAREAAPYMRQRGWGRIISLSGLAARRGGSILAATRNAAVVAASKTLADELGPHGINVTVVHPGMTYTERIPGMVASMAERDGISPAEAERRMGAGPPHRRARDRLRRDVPRLPEIGRDQRGADRRLRRTARRHLLLRGATVLAAAPAARRSPLCTRY